MFCETDTGWQVFISQNGWMWKVKECVEKIQLVKRSLLNRQEQTNFEVLEHVLYIINQVY
jgi:hypothetical protein